GGFQVNALVPHGSEAAPAAVALQGVIEAALLGDDDLRVPGEELLRAYQDADAAPQSVGDIDRARFVKGCAGRRAGKGRFETAGTAPVIDVGPHVGGPDQ